MKRRNAGLLGGVAIAAWACVASFGLGGCELAVEFDRSLIPYEDASVDAAGDGSPGDATIAADGDAGTLANGDANQGVDEGVDANGEAASTSNVDAGIDANALQDATLDVEAPIDSGEAADATDAADATEDGNESVDAARDASGSIDASEDAEDGEPKDAAADAERDASDGEADAGDGGDGGDAASRCEGVVCTALDQCHTAGVCDPETGLCSTPALTNGASCNDGNACTRTDTCQSGICVGSNAVTCTAEDQCHTAGTCNTTTGLCSNPTATDGTACNDGNACTRTDTCQGGTCTGGNAVTCSAQDQCHVAGTCNATTGLCSNPAATDGTTCNDGNACTSSDTCTAGVCAGTSYTCSPGVCQSSSTCNGNGGCTIVDSLAGASCTDDGNPCTTDACDGAGTCAHPSVSDGTSCGAGVVCSSGSCAADCFIGGSVISGSTVNPANACQVCDPSSSTSAWTTESDGTSCGTGFVCTSGSCVAIVPDIVTTSPSDGATPVAGTTISITFSTAMDPTTLTAQTSAGTCSGSVQVQHNDDSDSNCIAFASAMPVMSAGDTVATFTAAPGLLVNRAYTITVTTTAASAGGSTLASNFTTPSGFKTVSPTSPGVENESGSGNEANYCDMQFPTSYTGNAGDTVTFYGQIYEVFNGTQLTGTGSESPDITAQFGYAPANADGSVLSNPEYEAAWTWATASYNEEHYIDTHDGNDEYMYTFTLPASGDYTYTYRFSVDGGTSWTYADVGGAGSNGGLQAFDFGELSVLVVQ